MDELFVTNISHLLSKYPTIHAQDFNESNDMIHS